MSEAQHELGGLQRSTAQAIFANLTGKRHVEQDKKNHLKRKRKFFVHINRKPEIEATRAELPVCMHEQEIIEAIHSNDIILITGATGTGKTTQLPQFLVEDGFGDVNSPHFKGMIGVTQPRRVAAVSCASRVAHEMNSETGDIVGYQIRHQAKFTERTKIKFATDGIFLREVENDLYLKNYSAIIVDEVHERSLNTDLLLSFLSRSVKMRSIKEKEFGRLKVIIMSATLDVAGVFSGQEALFPDPPMVKVPSRQYPVTIHFSKKTVDNYVDEAYHKVAKIHKRLPPGGVLVFLSGRKEVEELCNKLEEELGKDPVKIPDHDGPPVRMQVLPFYALLADHHQKKVFHDFGEEVRKVIVATNVAETSVTIPGISYVVDSGRVKEKIYGQKGQTLMSSFRVVWVSKASAEQRAGRAGRTGPGHCYRLYSSAMFDQQFEEFRKPEILRTPVDAIVLRLRAMGIFHVAQFPFPTKPDKSAILSAEKLLTDIGALHPIDKTQCDDPDSWRDPRYDEEEVLMGVTKLGRDLARLPVAPRFGCMLLSASKHEKSIPYACRIAAILTVGSVLDKSKPEFRSAQKMLRNQRSDLLTELSAVCASEHMGLQKGSSGVKNSGYDMKMMRQFCSTMCIHFKTVIEVLAITKQLEALLINHQAADLRQLKPPDSVIENYVLRSLVSGFPDQIARRMSREEAAVLGIIPRRQKIAFVLQDRNEPAFLESGSSVHLTTDTDFVCYSSLEKIYKPKHRVSREEQDDYEYSSDDEHSTSEEGKKVECKDNEQEEEEDDDSSRLVLRGATPVHPSWIFEHAQALCEIKRRAEPKDVEYNSKLESGTEIVEVRYGQAKWGLGAMRVACKGRRGAPALAHALLCGRVRFYLHADKEIGEGIAKATSRRRISRELELYDIGSILKLKQVIRRRGDFLSNVVSSCIAHNGKREIVEQRWKEGINRLVEEDTNSESDTEEMERKRYEEEEGE